MEVRLIQYYIGYAVYIQDMEYRDLLPCLLAKLTTLNIHYLG